MEEVISQKFILEYYVKNHALTLKQKMYILSFLKKILNMYACNLFFKKKEEEEEKW